ncbi:MAG: GNAT family N-acetyltransferase [Ktedonobacteraceae bacterium]
MPETHIQGLIKKETLTEAEVTSIELLITTCNNYDGLHMRIDMGTLGDRQGGEANDFLYYEDGMLVGYLFVEGWGGRDRELVGMVHPDYRRRGIFRSLLAEAEEECRQRDIQKLILVCEHASQSGLDFVNAIQARFEYSEHEMVLGTFRERRKTHKGLNIRQANKEDLDAIVSILATDSGNVESIKEWVTKLFDDHSSRFYVAILDEKPLGCLRLDFMSDQIGIYAFEVRLGYRGLGYGRQMLEEAIRTIRSESQIRIMLDVETDNTNAINLYLSCGFEIKTTYDYYELKIS